MQDFLVRVTRFKEIILQNFWPLLSLCNIIENTRFCLQMIQILKIHIAQDLNCYD